MESEELTSPATITEFKNKAFLIKWVFCVLIIWNKLKKHVFIKNLGCSDRDDGSGGPVLPLQEKRDDESLSFPQ